MKMLLSVTKLFFLHRFLFICLFPRKENLNFKLRNNKDILKITANQIRCPKQGGLDTNSYSMKTEPIAH